ncbi:MAG: class III signal peptide-containing protein [Candidatus Hadarchaeota archaeon]
MRGQLSIEFLIVFVGMLLIAATVTYPLYDNARTDAEKMSALSEAREAANTMVNAINMVYASGPGSKQTVEYWLPKNVLKFYINLDEDGIATSTGIVAKNGRIDAQVRFDYDLSGAWDNKRDAIVLVDTLLPSRWYENGDNRGDNWITENAVTVEDWNLNLDTNHRVHHRVTLEYVYGAVSAAGALLWSDSIDHDSDFETTLFGYKLDVGVDNDSDNIKIDFEFGSSKIDDYSSAPPFILNQTQGGITVSVIVTPGLVEVRYTTGAVTSPSQRLIRITDVVLGSD